MFALGLSYNGHGYHGWQKQPNLKNTIQTALESALSYVADSPIETTCAGRTDAGVHATNQVIHFNTEKERSNSAWVFGVNSHLPQNIRVNWVQQVDPEFHARYSATARTYRYILYNQPVRSAFLNSLTTWFHRPLNINDMQKAAQCLIGEHDFSSFRAADCQSKTPFRHIEYIRFQQQGPFIICELKANAFLHHMVRNIMGCLLDIGKGRKTKQWLHTVLTAKTRSAASATAPANGLFLVEVDYPNHFLLPKTNKGPVFIQS